MMQIDRDMEIQAAEIFKSDLDGDGHLDREEIGELWPSYMVFATQDPSHNLIKCHHKRIIVRVA